MKRIIFILFLISQNLTVAQNSSVFTDNFSGVESALYNPANIADSFYKADITIFSTNLSVGNTFAAVKPFSVLKDLDSDKDNLGLKDFDNYVSKKDKSTNSIIYGNGTILGPSAFYTFKRNQAIGFTTAVRFNVTGNNLNTELFDLLSDNHFINDLNSLQNIESSNFEGYVQGTAWAEFGITYARVLKQSSSELLKVGGSLKLLRGLKNYKVSFENFEIDTNLNFNNSEESSVFVYGDVFVQNSVMATNFGQGLDLGIVYEKRKNTLPYYARDNQGLYYAKAPYTFKIAVAIKDIGSINFDKVETSINLVDLELPRNEIGNIYRFTQESDIILSTSKEKYILPTTLHLNTDFNLQKNIYINTNLDLFLLSNEKQNILKTVSNFSITPRFESFKFSAFLPFTMNRYGVFKSGLGFRTSYFYLGSSSLFTNFTNLSKEGDLYLGFKIPFRNKRIAREYRKSLKHHKL